MEKKYIFWKIMMKQNHPTLDLRDITILVQSQISFFPKKKMVLVKVPVSKGGSDV